MNLSIVIPAFNEEERLPSTLARIEKFLREERGELAISEIIIVDDGSTDRTKIVATKTDASLPVSCISLPYNQGKGAALRTGVLAAKGDLVLLYDADAATPIGEVLRLYDCIRDGSADIAIGSRIASTDDHPVEMSHLRRFIGHVYRFLSSGLIPGINDAACGCKLFKTDACKTIFAEQTINRFAYDIEILSIAIKRGYRIKEIPVSWRAIPLSRVRLIRDGLEMFFRLMQLYVRKIY